jgi:hypothetical protein
MFSNNIELKSFLPVHEMFIHHSHSLQEKKRRVTY